jgi:hypothetical protein
VHSIANCFRDSVDAFIQMKNSTTLFCPPERLGVLGACLSFCVISTFNI